MEWSPNIEAVLDLTELMPELRKRNPQLELHIAGMKSVEVLFADPKNGVFVHGFVDSVADFIGKYGILAAPIQFASGVRIKFLEAMAMGIPIVTTPAGALGIDHKGKDCLYVAETNEAFVDAIIELSTNPEKRKEIGANAIHYIEKNHNIDAISQKIVETFEANT
jgi:glycosyltransferase involved in cell wall biosynthesis